MLTFLQSYGTSVAQKVTVSKDNAHLQEILRDIRQQTGIDFIVRTEQLKIAKPVSIQAKNTELDVVLTEIFDGQSLSYIKKDNTIVVTNTRESAAITNVPATRKARTSNIIQGVLSGRVLDQLGEPVAGVSISAPNGYSTTTDDDGRFHLMISGTEARLQFRYIGFKSVSLVAKVGEPLEITMEQVISDLDELVVTGYTKEKRQNITGSIATISGEKLASRPLTNLASGLQGLAPGLVMTRVNGQPGNEQWLANVRGVSSINGDVPMVLIDGVRGNLSLVNPLDVESITILKDASSTAVFGSTGARGVILVTTKSGTGKIRVQYEGLFSAQRPARMPQLMSSYESALMENIARINAGGNPTFNDELLNLLRDPTITQRPDPNNPNNWQFLGDFDYVDLLTRRYTPQMNHNVSVSGGGDKESFLFSVGGYNQQGFFAVGPDRASRINARSNYNRKLSKHFSLDSRIQYTGDKVERIPTQLEGDYSAIYELFSRRRTVPLYDPERPGQYNEQFPLMGILESSGGQYLNSHEVSGVFTLQGNDIFVKNLNLRAVYSPRILTSFQDQQRRSVPVYDLSGQRGYIGGAANAQASISRIRSSTMWNNVQLVGDYAIDLGDHQINALAGYRYDDFRQDLLLASGRELPTNELFSLNYGNPNQMFVLDDIQTNAQISLFSTLEYIFANRYILRGTLNREGSSRLAPNLRWNTFPGVSAGWRINNESWFQASPKLSFINDLKLRATWGQQGNDPGVGNYQYIPMLQTANSYPFNNTRNQYFWQSQLPASLRTWERITSSDLGLDFLLFNSKLNGSFTYFWRETTGMLAPVPVPSVIGVGVPMFNIAEMKSWGWEFELGYRNQIGDFNYFVSGNIADNNNRITSYDGATNVFLGLNGIIEGYPVSSLFVYQADGYFQNQEQVDNHAFQNNQTGPGDIRYVDVNGDGIISFGDATLDNPGDLVYAGDIRPRYQFGLNFGVNYKGFDFSALIQGIGKRNFLLSSVMTVPFLDTWRQPWIIHEDYWTPENPDARFPRPLVGGGINALPSTHWLVNGAYARLKNLQIGYSLPLSWINRIGVSRSRIFVGGEDLFEVSRVWHPYIDPERPNNFAFNYPLFRTFTAGINLTF
ncbi:TonB-dependent receptor [Sphingobacterium sp. lm-10]|uniref:TonB-dependent receptor n=1 Tax=Sphingobacterium sp. lm-10 TaxID=2944904 RepID=UPI002020F47B|nr:TonB-dependent receptor [Sphingobacterium sp. lm-10]MCL7989168.1 TonB-dependent receptor [Sphingobacterium sp. lm-10]